MKTCLDCGGERLKVRSRSQQAVKLVGVEVHLGSVWHRSHLLMFTNPCVAIDVVIRRRVNKAVSLC